MPRSSAGSAAPGRGRLARYSRADYAPVVERSPLDDNRHVHSRRRLETLAVIALPPEAGVPVLRVGCAGSTSTA